MTVFMRSKYEKMFKVDKFPVDYFPPIKLRLDKRNDIFRNKVLFPHFTLSKGKLR